MTRPSSEDDQLVVLEECRNELEAQELRSVLVDSGIPAFVFEKETLGIGLGCTGSGFTGAQVKVPRSQQGHARAALEESRSRSAEIDWDHVDVGDPVPEVMDVLENRSLVHNTRRIATALGPVVGLGFLVLALAGIVLFFVL
ncbi:MAG: hypothetical protein VXY94_11065 [Planctomycetota bacterium]|nr:hypothetical protein [Planctomycetota bacterium]MEC8734906.1 hypothetical protein [Planctomycetota bacterium]MEC9158225.1 hypothetical protein [Planctomycetota bacterium]MED5507863.1 hypothetical protein [Planctomycetota bacterium]